MIQVFMSKHGLTPIKLCTAIFCLFLMVGCVISPRRTVGGGGGTPTPTPTATPTPNPAATGKLYASTPTSILRFDNAFAANGNTAAAATISGGATTIAGAAFMTLDAAADRLYVANTDDSSVVVYDTISTRTGNVTAAPTRTISAVSMLSPTDVALDKARNLLYVADDIFIHVFSSASTINGTVTPKDLQTTFAVSSVFIDATNDRLYVADQIGTAINIYDSASTLVAGNITANRTLFGAATHLGNPVSIQIDSLGRLIVSNSSPASITIYSNAAGVNANQAPIAEIGGSATGLVAPNQIIVDPTGTGTLYVADPGANKIVVFAGLNTATGNDAPAKTITGTALTAGSPLGVAVDNTR